MLWISRAVCFLVEAVRSMARSWVLVTVLLGPDREDFFSDLEAWINRCTELLDLPTCSAISRTEIELRARARIAPFSPSVKSCFRPIFATVTHCANSNYCVYAYPTSNNLLGPCLFCLFCLFLCNVPNTISCEITVPHQFLKLQRVRQCISHELPCPFRRQFFQETSVRSAATALLPVARTKQKSYCP